MPNSNKIWIVIGIVLLLILIIIGVWVSVSSKSTPPPVVNPTPPQPQSSSMGLGDIIGFIKNIFNKNSSSSVPYKQVPPIDPYGYDFFGCDSTGHTSDGTKCTQQF